MTYILHYVCLCMTWVDQIDPCLCHDSFFFVVCDVDQKVCAIRCATICASRMCQRSRSRFLYKGVLCVRLAPPPSPTPATKNNAQMAVYSHMAFTSGVVSVHNIARCSGAQETWCHAQRFLLQQVDENTCHEQASRRKHEIGSCNSLSCESDILSDKLSLRCIPCISFGTYWGGGLSLSFTHSNT